MSWVGTSHALYEEAMFDEGGVTSRDWNTYPIAKMRAVKLAKCLAALEEYGRANPNNPC